MSFLTKMGVSALNSMAQPAPRERPLEEWSTDELRRYRDVLLERVGLARWGGRVAGFLGTAGARKYLGGGR